MTNSFDNDYDQRINDILDSIKRKKTTIPKMGITIVDVWSQALQDTIDKYISEKKYAQAVKGLVSNDALNIWEPSAISKGTRILIMELSRILVDNHLYNNLKYLWHTLICHRKKNYLNTIKIEKRRTVQSSPEAKKEVKKWIEEAHQWVKNTFYDYSLLMEPLKDKRKAWLNKEISSFPEFNHSQESKKADLRKMNEELFWEIIDKSRKNVADWKEQETILIGYLEKLKPKEIIAFQKILMKKICLCYRHDLWAVAWIANHGCSDDGFEYFCAGMISKGRRFFHAALKEPSKAVRGVKPGNSIEREEMLYVAVTAYENTKRKFPYNKMPLLKKIIQGDAWKENDLPKLYPNLCKQFGFVISKNKKKRKSNKGISGSD